MTVFSALTTTLLPIAVEGQVFEASFAVNNAAVDPLTISAGTTQTGKNALPSGLSYSATGRITGTPARGTAGTYLLSVKVSDGTTSVDNNALTLIIVRSYEDMTRMAIGQDAGGASPTGQNPAAVLDQLLLA